MERRKRLNLQKQLKTRLQLPDSNLCKGATKLLSATRHLTLLALGLAGEWGKFVLARLLCHVGKPDMKEKHRLATAVFAAAVSYFSPQRTSRCG